jgi:hypothetical protein
VSGHSSSDDGGVDWRRLASDRNVSPGVARALWDQARAAAPDDPAQAEHAFHLMLDEAEAVSATQEPGRETLAASNPGVRDAGARGPGKWTRVLLEQGKPAASGAQPAPDTGKKASPEDLRKQLAAVGQAGKQAAAALAASDPATILEALRELRDRQGPGVVQKLMTVAGGAVERMLAQRGQPPTQAAAATPASAERAAPAAPDRARTAPPRDRGR